MCWLLLVLTACATDQTIVTKTSYQELPGWTKDDHAAPLKLFVDSCEVNQTRARAYQTKSGEEIGDLSAWQRVCTQAALLPKHGKHNHAVARAFFEKHFTPHRIASEQHPQARITGYYEPVLKGSLRRSKTYAVPVYGVPYAKEDRYFSRADIEEGALKDKAPVLLYVNDPVMLFFTQVQGSGKVRLPSGKLVGLQYAGQNGQEYVAIGKVLKENYCLQEVSMQTIRDWLHAHPEQAAAVMNQNPSYVYFKLADGKAYAKGALSVPLTPLRSIAVDDDRAAYGVPTYIATTHEDYHTKTQQSLTRLFVSQDTGGALKGPHRTDIFFGRGKAEEWSAGLQNALGDVYWLLPNLPPKPAEIETANQ